MKVCIVTTVDSSLCVLFPDFYPLLLDKGYEVVGICSDGPWLDKVRNQGVRVIVVPMTRGFSVLSDLRCLWKMWRIFRVEQFDLVHYSTPKAALLAGLAGRAAGISAMLYTLRGLGYNSFTGWRRSIGRLCDRIACRCAHRVIAISHSLKTEAVKERLLAPSSISVLGAGSSKGVDLDKFQRGDDIENNAERIRNDLGISRVDTVIGFVGRPTLEKGINELVKAFCNLKTEHLDLHLLLIGHRDQRDPLSSQTETAIRECEGVHMLGFKDNVHEYITAMDILALPSYREGFGNSLIEASALEVPVIATDVPGCRDAVIDGKTGILVKPRDVSNLQNALAELIDKPEKRVAMGRCGRDWVRSKFDRRVVWERLVLTYQQMLDNSIGPGDK